MRRFFHEEAHVPVEVVLFQSYEAQVLALLSQRGSAVPYIDIAWNTNLAYLQADEWSDHTCRAIAMRDTDRGWMTKIVAVTGGSISALADLKDRTLALGSRDSGHAAILPVHFLEDQGMREGKDYRSLRFDSDLGKHGDTGTSEVEVVRAVLDGRADAGAVGNRFWSTVQNERLVPMDSLREIWSSPAYNHCMFTARPDFDRDQERRFVEALLGMSYDNPIHREILDAEGLQRWLTPHLDGYEALRQAAAEQGFFKRLSTQAA
jgi:phosphonate transport system substrate-binding protein